MTGGPADRFAAAKQQHFRGVDGDADAAQSADRSLADLLETSPKDPLIRAYAGSTKLLLARDASAPWTKQSYAVEGVKLLNQAVDQAPNDLEIRLVRGMAIGHLPEAFGQSAKSASDITWAGRQAQQRLGDNAPLEPELAAAALYQWGRLRAGDSAPSDEVRRLWRMAVQVAPDSRGGHQAARSLAQLDR